MVRMEDTTDLKVAHLPAEENALSRRYLRIIEKWVHVGVEYFQRWPERPNCGHFFGGVHAYGLESFSPAEAFAFASTSSEFDEKAAGVSKDELREMAIQAVRYLCFTHDSGPAECVRPSVGFGREKFLGTKWGERGQGFFRESQCGHAVAGLARICLLLRDWVDDETWMMVARVQEDYAERFGSMEPKSGVYRDTQMEENFWTSHGLSACYLFLSRHEKAAAWEAMTRRWMYSTCSAPQDTKDFGLVGAETASDLAFKTFTSLPDYWAENHGMVHPSYTAAGVRALMAVGTQLKMWGRDLPPELFWNRRRIYENLKAMTDGAGYAQAVQGMDWHYLPAAGIDVPHAIASVFFDDPDAAALQLRGLENTERRQEGNGGRFYDREFAEKAHDQIDAMILRELHIRDVGQLYFMHRIFGPGADPAPQRELEARLMGVRTYPHAGFVHHRHARGQTSFSWRNSIMALPLTREGIYTISPCSDSWLGHPVVKNRPDSHRLNMVRVAVYDGGFAAAMTMDRCQESLRQQVLFASLPDGCVLSFERFVAQEDLVIQSLDQGFLQIANENFPLFAPNCCGVRTLYHPEGSTEYEGWFGDAESEDVVDALGRPSWLNIDGRMGIVFSGTGQTVYHNRHFFEVYRVIADDLTLSRQQGDLSLCSGESAGHLAALLIPEQAHVETASASFSTLTGPENSICLAANGFWAMANFDAGYRRCTFSQARLEEIPFLPGVRVEAKGAGL
ncbi:MAG: hypothetical protein O2954_17915, partial [bacterium]|nr:hypothetical protein [bacterium]